MHRYTKKWHTNLIISITAIWGISTMLLLAGVMISAPAGMLDLFEKYLFLLAPTLMIAGSFLLYKESRLSPIPFALLPPLVFILAIKSNPIYDTKYVVINAKFLTTFPEEVQLTSAFFFACFIYALFLNKHNAKKLIF